MSAKPPFRRSRTPRDTTFRQADVVRAFRAARVAGIADPVVRIDPMTKEITVSGGAAKMVEPNPWDEVLQEPGRAAPKRRS